MPRLLRLGLEADWYISPGIHIVLDVHCLFDSRSHASVLVSLCSRLRRACPCYSRQDKTSRHHNAQLHRDRWVRSIHTPCKCGILQSIVNKKLGLWRCVHPLLSHFKHTLRQSCLYGIPTANCKAVPDFQPVATGGDGDITQFCR